MVPLRTLFAKSITPFIQTTDVQKVKNNMLKWIKSQLKNILLLLKKTHQYVNYSRSLVNLSIPLNIGPENELFASINTSVIEVTHRKQKTKRL